MDDMLDLSRMSPGMPLPQTSQDFLPDVSWATDISWDPFDEAMQGGRHSDLQQGQTMGSSGHLQDEPASPPSCWPSSGPLLLTLPAKACSEQALNAPIFEGEIRAAPESTFELLQQLSNQERDPPATLLGSTDPSFAVPDHQKPYLATELGEAQGGAQKESSCSGLTWGSSKGLATIAPHKPSKNRIRKRQRPKQLDFVAKRKVKFPTELPRMSPQCLRNAHKVEAPPSQLLCEAMTDVNPDLFNRCANPADDYTNLEEISLYKSTGPEDPPFVVATSSQESAGIIRDVWSAQRSKHLGRVMIRPPKGPAAPTSCLVVRDQAQVNTPTGELAAAAAFAQNGVAASPKHCQGLPPQCESWIDAPDIPLTPLTTDFSLMARNVGRLRRSGYLHVLTSSQLSCIAAMPGSIAVRFLMIIATLLGQPLIGSAMPLLDNRTEIIDTIQGQIQFEPASLPPLPLTQSITSDNPKPRWSWHPNVNFHKQVVHLGETEVVLLLGHLPAMQITLPTAQRRLMRLDRIVDLKEISALQYNAVRWTSKELASSVPLTRDNFRILAGYDSEQTSVEYYLHRHPLSAPACQAMALARHGRLPMTEDEVKYATSTLHWPLMLWLQTSQVSAKSEGKFKYRLHLGTRQLLPPSPDYAPCHIFHIVGGEAKQISTNGIGAHYLWYQHTGQGGHYHVYSPWSLAVAMATNGSCSIFVPSAAHTKPPPQYLQRCLILRNGSVAATNQKQLQSALALQQSRLLAIEGLPCEARLDNQEHTLGPLHLDSARVVQPLQAGEERLLLESSPQALQLGDRPAPLKLQDFRPLQTEFHGRLNPQPTPAALLAMGSTLLATAGSFVVSSVTQDILTEAMSKIAAAGKYRYVDPILLKRAITAPNRKAYLQSFNTAKQNRSYSWDEQQGIVLLKGLKTLGHIPSSAASDETQLTSGLAIVTSAADTLEDFNVAGLREIESVALNFLASSDLSVDSKGGALVYVLRSGSVALVSYYLSTIDTAPALLSHKLHGLPAFQASQPDASIAIDLPRLFTLTHLPAQVNSTAAQSSCARALTSQEYVEALGAEHPACVTKEMTRIMMQTLYSNSQTKVIQTTSAPGKHMTAFLACSGSTAKRFTLHSEVNVFVVPSHCNMDLSLVSKLKSIKRTHTEKGQIDFQWLLSYNTSAYDRPLTRSEEVHIALYSVTGAVALFALLAAGVAFKFKHRLPCLRPAEPAPNTYFSYDKATIYHPHLGPRTMTDFSSSAESVECAAEEPQPRPTAGALSPFVRPSAIRDYTRFAGYSATVRRAPRRSTDQDSRTRAPLVACKTDGQNKIEESEL